MAEVVQRGRLDLVSQETALIGVKYTSSSFVTTTLSSKKVGLKNQFHQGGSEN